MRKQQQPTPAAASHEPESKEAASFLEEGASQAGPEWKPFGGSVRLPVVLAVFSLMLLPPLVIFYNRTPSLFWLCNCRPGTVEGRTDGFAAGAERGSQNCSVASSNITKVNSLDGNVTKEDFRNENVTQDNTLQPNVTKDSIPLQSNATDDNTLQPNPTTEDNIPQQNGPKDNTVQKNDELLGGLLAAGFDEGSCLSRYQSVLYRRKSPYIPSPYLVERLRKHEALQKRCGPNTEPYKEAIKQLQSKEPPEQRKKKKGKDRHTMETTTECKYVILLPFSGLGNRMMSLASAFLYALLTDRVLLIERNARIGYLFCEPFPETTWLLPRDFPLSDMFHTFLTDSPHSLGSMLKKKKAIREGGKVPPFVYLHLCHDFSEFDQRFFCDDSHRILQQIPFLMFRTNEYLVPSFFLVPAFEEELDRLFPEKDTVFHHLGRYLFHPTNPVWGLITRSYDSYLSRADERVGLQIRVFDRKANATEHLPRILNCALEYNMLPNISLDGPVASSTGAKSKLVLVTSLDSAYFEQIRSMYWEHPTATGEIVSVYQPSHEGVEQTGEEVHEMKAWAEIYLLSLSDALVTSTWSTFGYVAQGLAGVKPLITLLPADPSCRIAMSMEPCYHFPPLHGCKANTSLDSGAVVPHVRHCEDKVKGVKLVNPIEH